MTQEEIKKYSDPRRFNLILTLDANKVQGWFVEYGSASATPTPVISVPFVPEADKTLSLIENAIYDNPILLEDYDCRILIPSTQLLVYPQEAPAEFINHSMNRFYHCAPEDIFLNRMGNATMAFTLCPGLKSFLSRTFAGVTPWHPLYPLWQWFAEDNSAPGQIRVYADIEPSQIYLLAFNGLNMLHASAHPVASTEDAAYFIFALWKHLGLNSDAGQLNISGNSESRKELTTLLRRHLNYVAPSLLPVTDKPANIPTSILLCFKDHDNNID